MSSRGPRNTALFDQIDAACAEVRTYVANLQRNPPPGAHFRLLDDMVERALSDRLDAELRQNRIQFCCPRTNTPRPLYWVPRHRVILCAPHWDAVEMCMCFEECDACRLPAEGVKCVYMFMGPYIMQTLLCFPCSDRLRLSPTGG